jgi:hypothetical protein
VPRIPYSVSAAIGRIYSAQFSHAAIEGIFYEAGADGDPPVGNKHEKCVAWLKRIDEEMPSKALKILGKVLLPFLEGGPLPHSLGYDSWQIESAVMLERLEASGLKYISGGRIQSLKDTGQTSQTLRMLIEERNFPAVIEEFNRATKSIDLEPREAVSAASNILEAICKEYLIAWGLEMPRKLDLASVFSAVRKDLGFDPSAVEDSDLKKVLSGLFSIVDGISALRTHASSAHAQATSRRIYKLDSRHARLAVGAAHVTVLFLIESWEAKDRKRQR